MRTAVFLCDHHTREAPSIESGGSAERTVMPSSIACVARRRSNGSLWKRGSSLLRKKASCVRGRGWTWKNASLRGRHLRGWSGRGSLPAACFSEIS